MRNKVLFAFVAFFISLFAYGQSKEKVAIYVIGDVNESIQKVISSKAAARISRSDRLIAVERTDDFLAALTREQDYQVSGEVRDDQIAEIGARFGVRYVAIFDANQIEDTGFMTARLIDVESGLVVKSVDNNRKIQSLNDWINISNNVAYRLVSEKSK